MRILLLTLWLISGYTKADEELMSLEMLNELSKDDVVNVIRDKAVEEGRMAAIKEIGFTLASQQSFLKTIKFHEGRISSANHELNDIWNFIALQQIASDTLEQTDASLEIYVLPPILSEVKNKTAIGANSMSLKIDETTYQIRQHAKLVTRPLNWKDYLLSSNYSHPALPPPALLPKNSNEREAWKKAIKAGWKIGVEQANREIKSRIRRLAIDFLGMTKYIKLYQQGILAAPIVALQKIAYENKGDILDINSSIYQITEGTRFKKHSAWTSSSGDDRGSAKGLKSLLDALRAKDLIEDVTNGY